MMVKFINILILQIIIYSSLFSQKEDWLWYNANYGVTFNTPDTMPRYIYDKTSTTASIVATISDNNANLLFYCSSDSIWNKKHKIMQNGVINQRLTYNPIIVCNKPGNKYQYYLFHLTPFYYRNELFYSIIDLSEDNNYGAVVVKNILLDSSINLFNIIYHENGIDLWLIGFNFKDKIFKTYLISKDGINTKPIITKENRNIMAADNAYNMSAHFDVSPNNKKIVIWYLGDQVLSRYMNHDLYNFDNNTGEISFISTLDTNLNILFDIPNDRFFRSFSSNSRFYYTYNYYQILDSLSGSTKGRNVKYLYQFDTQVDSNTKSINRNLIYVDSITSYFSSGVLKLAPNKIIYMKEDFRPSVLGEISNADSLGNVCKFDPNKPSKVSHHPAYQFYRPCYYCFYASVKEPVCEGDTIYLEGNLSARFVNPEFYWTGPNGFTSKERNPIIPNAEKNHSGLYKLYTKADTAQLYDSVFVNVFDRQRAKISYKGSLQLCRNGSIELESEYKHKSYKYLWSNGSTKEKITVNKGGVYKLLVTNEAGCVGIDSVEVFDPPVVRIISNKDGLCFGETGSIRFETDYNALSYEWSNGSKDTSIIVTEPGVYKLYYEFGNCRDSQEIKVNDYGKIGARIIGDSVVCKGDSVWLQAFPQAYNYKYLWSTGSKDYEIKISGNKELFLIIENEYGCKDTAYFALKEVEYLKPKIAGGNGICEGQKKVIYALTPSKDNIYKYIWSTGDTTKEITINKAGIYFLEVSINGKCRGFDTIIIRPSEPPRPQIEGESYICRGRTSILKVNDDYSSYKWNTGDTSRQIIIDKAGTYTVTVTDTNGCEGTTSLDVKEYDVQMSGITDNNFGKVNIGSIRTSTLLVKNGSNSGVELLKIYSKNYPDIFNITTIPALPHTLKHGETIEITVSFKPKSTQIYQDSLIIESVQPCQNLFTAYLTGEGIQSSISSTVWLPDTTAQTGTENYRLPLKAILMQDTTISNLSYNAEISFDGTYFQPEGISKGKLEQNTIVSGDRVIKISGEIPSLSENETILTEISGLVLLGKPEPAILRIISFDLSSPEIKTEKKDGSLTVSGVCNQGLSNLVKAENLVFEIAENPVNDELTINISGKRSEAQIKLEIYNVLGEIVQSGTHPLIPSQEGNIRIDVSGLAPGIYFIRIGDWTGKFVKIK